MSDIVMKSWDGCKLNTLVPTAFNMWCLYTCLVAIIQEWQRMFPVVLSQYRTLTIDNKDSTILSQFEYRNEYQASRLASRWIVGLLVQR